MNKKIYALLIIIVAGAIITAGIMAIPKHNSNVQKPSNKINGILVLSGYITGTGIEKINVNKTWAEIYVSVTYEPLTLKNDSYVELQDPLGHIYNLGVSYTYTSPGVKYSSSQSINLNLPPPLKKGPYGTWKIVYHLPKTAYVYLKVYDIPLNNTTS